jgi:hypothetical protein
MTKKIDYYEVERSEDFEKNVRRFVKKKHFVSLPAR